MTGYLSFYYNIDPNAIGKKSENVLSYFAFFCLISSCLKTKNKTDIGPFYPLGTEATSFSETYFPENIKELEVNKQTRFCLKYRK